MVDGFVGREWLRARLDAWQRSEKSSRLFWLSGGAGAGKSAFAAWLAHRNKVNVIGINLCRYNDDDRRDAGRVIRTLAFQIATRLPDYRRLLLDRLKSQDPDGEEVKRKNPAGLFSWLLIEPLHRAIDGGREKNRFLVVIDEFDETVHDGRSELSEILRADAGKLQAWSPSSSPAGRKRPIKRQFAGLQPVRGFESEIGGKPRRRSGLPPRMAGNAKSAGGAGQNLARPHRRRVQREISSTCACFARLWRRERCASTRRKVCRRNSSASTSAGSAAFFPIARPMSPMCRCSRGLPPPTPGAGAVAVADVRLVDARCGADAAKPPQPVRAPHGGRHAVSQSLRDWLVDPEKAGADFVVDQAEGTRRLVEALWSSFVQWAKQPDSPLNSFCVTELPIQIARSAAADVGNLAALHPVDSDPIGPVQGRSDTSHRLRMGRRTRLVADDGASRRCTR